MSSAAHEEDTRPWWPHARQPRKGVVEAAEALVAALGARRDAALRVRFQWAADAGVPRIMGRDNGRAPGRHGADCDVVHAFYELEALWRGADCGVSLSRGEGLVPLLVIWTTGQTSF